MKMKYKFDEPLSIVIPAYNEEGNIEKVVNDTLKEAKRVCLKDFEIVVVNDGSKDNTDKIIDKLDKKNRNVHVFHHKKNKGLASAWKTAIENAKNDVILYIEGDGQQPFKEQIGLLKKIKNNDLVLGYRSYRFDYTPTRKLFSYGYLFLIWLLFGLNYKDVGWSQCYRKEIFKKIKMNSVTPFFDTEVVIKAIRYGFKVTEAKSYYQRREKGSTSLGNLKTAWSMFSEMLKMRIGLLD